MPRVEGHDELLPRKTISLLEWPGNFPDPDPIENLWTMLNARLGMYNKNKTN